VSTKPLSVVGPNKLAMVGAAGAAAVGALVAAVAGADPAAGAVAGAVAGAAAGCAATWLFKSANCFSKSSIRLAKSAVLGWLPSVCACARDTGLKATLIAKKANVESRITQFVFLMENSHLLLHRCIPLGFIGLQTSSRRHSFVDESIKSCAFL
jgi:hypothetical protein